MHWEAFRFVELVTQVFPALIRSKAVLEIGSCDVNGSIRSLFEPAAHYVGVDLCEGPGVDLVASGHEVELARSFDIAVSCECFEHNPYYLETFENMARHTRPGGLVVFTCATTGRPEHGTRRTNEADSPGTAASGWDYYNNLVPSDFAGATLDRLFHAYRFFESPRSQDVYFCGVVKGGEFADSHASALVQVELEAEHLLAHAESLHDFEQTPLSGNDLANATQILEDLHAPRSLVLSQRLIRIFMGKKLFALALDEIARAEETHGHIDSVSKQKWQSLSQSGRPVEAIAIAEDNLARSERLPEDLMAVAWLYRQAGLLSEARERLEEALVEDPNHPEIRFRLSVVAKERGDKAAALSHIRVALDHAAPRANYLFHYARVCRANHDLETAKSALQDALELDPNTEAYRSELEAITNAMS